MAIPEYQPSELEKRLKATADRNNAAEFDRVFKAFEEEYTHLKYAYPFMRPQEKRDDEPPFFVQVIRSMMAQLAGHSNFFNKRANPGQVRDCLTEIFSCPYSYKRKCWALKYPLRKDVPDNQNLIETETDQHVVANQDVIKVRDLIADLLRMVGMLARQIHSCEMQRILRLIVATKNRPYWGLNVNKDEAVRLADEIVYCFEAIKSEITLLSPEERVQLCYPRFPHHRPDIVIHTEPPTDLSSEEKTKLSREKALKLFKHENFSLMSYFGFNCEPFDAVKTTEEEVDALAKTLREDRPDLDCGRDEFDYKTLGDVLSADLRLYFEEFFPARDFDEQYGGEYEYEERRDITEDTKQQEAKDRIIAKLRNVMDDGIRLAANSRSKSLDLWQTAQVLFEQHEGDFHSYSAEDDDITEADLRKFLYTLRQARKQLWADWMRHERKDIKVDPIPTIPEGPVIEAIAQNTGTLVEASKPPARNRDDLIDIILRVKKDGLEGKIPGVSSVQTAINYIRHSLTPNQPYYHESVWANDFIAGFVANKKTKAKNGIESAWASIRRQCSGRSDTPKEESLAPTTILYRGVEHLADGLPD